MTKKNGAFAIEKQVKTYQYKYKPKKIRRGYPDYVYHKNYMSRNYKRHFFQLANSYAENRFEEGFSWNFPIVPHIQ